MTTKRRVFISYSHDDSVWARKFAQILSNHGVDVWFDDFVVQPGENLREAIESGLRESDIVVALIDSKSSNRPALFFELGAAIGLGKRVVAIVPKDFDSSDLPQSIRLRRYLLKDSPEKTAGELLSAIS